MTVSGEPNAARFRPGQRAGHYESWFQRANHPTRPLAFWIRYTLFSPDGHPEQGIGELWAIVFDGETGRHVAVKREVPIAGVLLGREQGDAFRVAMDGAELHEGPPRSAPGPSAGRLAGAAASGDHRVTWDLRYRGDARPLLLLPPALYEAPLPKAKSLVGLPLAVYEGTLDVDGQALDVGGWVGSQNHNWGAKHTDEYAWGQVAGFDGHPGSFLEVATARLKLGPVRTPRLTPLVLRHEGREHAVRTPVEVVRARGSFRCFAWSFRAETAHARVEGRIWADAADFVGLSYLNPPGGTKDCLNTKIASCEVTLTYTSGARAGEVETLRATRRAAFEILTDDRAHGVAIRA